MDAKLKAQFGSMIDAHLKDVLTGTRPSGGWLYENGPFSLTTEDLLSASIAGGSPLLNWIPSRLVDYRYTTVAHLEWVAPEGFDGSETYREFLRSVEIDECDFGPTAVWSGFEYQTEGAEWSFQSPVLKDTDFGLRDYDRTPIYAVRGDNRGQALATDAEWATARALILMEQHMNYNIIYGDRNNSVMEFDGLDTILNPGYVQSKVVGPGVPYFANPLVVNAATISDPAVLLDTIRGVVRKIRSRIRRRGWSVGPDDMAIVLPDGLWPYIAEAYAAGGGINFTNVYGFDGAMTFRDFNAELARIRTGGLGYGFIDVDGTPIPVLPDPNMGVNIDLDVEGTDVPAIAGDIFVLTRRVNGMTILEQKYINWNEFDYPTNGTEQVFRMPMFDGLVKGGWKIVNNSCFQYYVKAAGRLDAMYLPFQARINNVVLPTLMANENESGAFWSQDFYAYDGGRGGAGTSFLTPL